MKTLPVRLSVGDIPSVTKPSDGLSWNSELLFTTAYCRYSESFMKTGAVSGILYLREEIRFPCLLSYWGNMRYSSSHNAISSERHLLLSVVKGFLPLFSILLSYLDKIQHRSARIAFEYLQVKRKSMYWKAYFTQGHKRNCGRIFNFFLSDLSKCSAEDVHKNVWVGVSSVEIGAVEVTLY